MMNPKDNILQEGSLDPILSGTKLLRIESLGAFVVYILLLNQSQIIIKYHSYRSIDLMDRF
jgi:hypothetical protein